MRFLKVFCCVFVFFRCHTFRSPPQVSTLKGTGANLIYCEEAAYMDMGVFYEVIVPLMQVRGTATICISTPLGPWNFYSALTEVRDHRGELVFNVIQVSTACRRCVRRGKQASCEHPSVNVPAWKDEDTFDKMRAMYGDNTTLLKREIMGLVADDGSTAFETAHLKRFFERASEPEPHAHVSTLYMAIDPNGGGSTDSGSETAIVSFYYREGRVVASTRAAAPARDSSLRPGRPSASPGLSAQYISTALSQNSGTLSPPLSKSSNGPPPASGRMRAIHRAKSPGSQRWPAHSRTAGSQSKPVTKSSVCRMRASGAVLRCARPGSQQPAKSRANCWLPSSSDAYLAASSSLSARMTGARTPCPYSTKNA